MSFTQQDVVNQATTIGALNAGDSTLMERTNTTAGQIIAKATVYLGYDVTTVDALLPILGEITVTQINHYQNLQTAQTSGSTKKVTRGDYTVEYDNTVSAYAFEQSVWQSYEWILKKYKKLRSL